MFTRTKARCRSDRADSSIVSFIFIIPLLFGFLMTMIDVSVYFSNRATIQQIARDGARTIGIFGGAGTETTVSPLEKSYGQSVAACADGRSLNKTSIECQVLDRYDDNVGLTNVAITQVDCGPERSTAVGSTAYCDVAWRYNGIPGSTLSFLNTPSKNTGGANAIPGCTEGSAALACNRTRVVGQFEVNMTGVTFPNR